MMCDFCGKEAGTIRRWHPSTNSYSNEDCHFCCNDHAMAWFKSVGGKQHIGLEELK